MIERDIEQPLVTLGVLACLPMYVSRLLLMMLHTLSELHPLQTGCSRSIRSFGALAMTCQEETHLQSRGEFCQEPEEVSQGSSVPMSGGIARVKRSIRKESSPSDGSLSPVPVLRAQPCFPVSRRTIQSEKHQRVSR